MARRRQVKMTLFGHFCAHISVGPPRLQDIIPSGQARKLTKLDIDLKTHESTNNLPPSSGPR